MATTDSALTAPVREGGLAPGRLRELSRIDPWRGVAHIALEWAAIAAAALACERFWHPALYVATVVWIGARQHALGILAHDAAHYRILPGRAANDGIGELCLAWPLGLSVRDYRSVHLDHHRHLNTARDPDWARNRPDRLRTRRGALALWSILLGLGQAKGDVLRVFAGKARERTAADRRWAAARIAFLAGGLAAVTALGAWRPFLLYWVVPLGTWFVLTLRVCGTAEHFAVPGDDALTGSRSTECSWLTQLLIAPKNVHYHLEHHLYPSVPFYRLPRLRAELMRGPAFRERAHRTRGYLGFLRECAAANRAPA